MPREGHDRHRDRAAASHTGFQSTCPARGTTILSKAPTMFHVFQSTCPARGTTWRANGIVSRDCYFNPRAPRGARLVKQCLHNCDSMYFNPRAPRGARLAPCASGVNMATFQSTCPARGTTYRVRVMKENYPISIHVPREGHDGFSNLPTINFIISIHVPREGHDWAYIAPHHN